MLTVDGRCFCHQCVGRTENIYRMIGRCYNCGQTDILMIYRAGDKAAQLDCPTCGGRQEVHPNRLATPDEIPVA